MKKLKLNKKILYIIVLLLLIIVIPLLMHFLKPKITLKGKEVVVINLNEKYEEPGASATQLSKDITSGIMISGKVDENKVGTYTINYKLKKYGLTFEKKRLVKVVDKVYPTIVLEDETEIVLCPNQEFKEPGYKANDNYDGDITSKVKTIQKDNSVLYSVKDSSGNETEITRKIIYKDDQSPTLKLKGSKNIYLKLNDEYKELGYEVSDNCDSDLEKNIKITNNVNTHKEGSYQVAYTIEDKSSNKATTTRNVYVKKSSSNKTEDSINKTETKGIIYLTFDDGPSKSITPKMLDILKEKNVKATFFVINHDNSLNYIIKRASDEGHTIGLHSYTHNYKQIYSSVDNYFNDLDKISKKVHSITGKNSNIIRFPGGTSNTISKKYSKGIMTTLSKEVEKQGYKYYDWNIGSGDSGGAKTKEEVYKNVTSSLRKNRSNIVLMHDFENNYKTLNALSDIIDYGVEHGYEFKAITNSTKQIVHSPNN